jgi:Xaa-Pro aminopeptidase
VHRREKRTARLIVASSERDANMLYATGFFAPDSFVYLSAGGKSYIVIGDLEIDRARRQAKVHRCLSLSQIERQLHRQKDPDSSLVAVLQRVFDELRIGSVEVPADFPLEIADLLRRKRITVTPIAGTFFPERDTKTELEVREITRAQRAAEAAMDAAIALIRESRISRTGFLKHGQSKLTAEMVKERIATTALHRGYIAAHTIVACGVQACEPHNEGSGLLRAHQPIILDIFPRSQTSGYWGDITRTVVRGQAKASVKRLFEAVLKAQSTAMHRVKAGVTGAEIHQAVLDSLAFDGFSTGVRKGKMEGMFHGTGHGVGLEIHEKPRLSHRANEPLKERQVVTVEPGLYYWGVGGMRIEDLLVVESHGYRNLTRYPKFLEI